MLALRRQQEKRQYLIWHKACRYRFNAITFFERFCTGSVLWVAWSSILYPGALGPDFRYQQPMAIFAVLIFSIFFFPFIMPPRKPLVPFEVIVVVHYSTININTKYLGSISKHNSLLPLLPASWGIGCKFSNTNISSLTGAVDARCHLLAQLLDHCPCSHGNCHC